MPFGVHQKQMGERSTSMKALYTLALTGLLVLSGPGVSGKIYAQTPKPQLKNTPDRSQTTIRLANEVRHQLVTMPYYGVFDWLEGQILPNDTVILRGQVTTPSTKSDAEHRVKKIESVAKVQNQIEVLPLSQFDDQIRRQVYHAI